MPICGRSAEADLSACGYSTGCYNHTRFGESEHTQVSFIGRGARPQRLDVLGGDRLAAVANVGRGCSSALANTAQGDDLLHADQGVREDRPEVRVCKDVFYQRNHHQALLLAISLEAKCFLSFLKSHSHTR